MRWSKGVVEEGQRQNWGKRESEAMRGTRSRNGETESGETDTQEERERERRVKIKRRGRERERESYLVSHWHIHSFSHRPKN